MKILGIETSCDETAIAIVENGTTVITSVIATTKQDFADLGGVIPEDAARKQLESIIPVLHKTLHDATLQWSDIDYIAVTKGPGLLGSLLIGTVTARALSSIHTIPLIGVHHTLGHLSSTWLDSTTQPEFPIITLSASGGHTDLWYRTSHTTGTLISSTRDDAAGEAFDKGASMLGLPYPGGPSISASAETGIEDAYKFTVPLHNEDTLDFSFSGLKTALKYVIRDLGDDWKLHTSDLAASFQYAICNHLVSQVVKALQVYPETVEVHIVGGVSANTRLRSMLQERVNLPVRHPTTLRYCTDNAAMIASAAYYMTKEHVPTKAFTTSASIPLSSVITQ